MDAVAAERQVRDPARWLIFGGVAVIVVSTVALWAWLPEPIAVQWRWSGEPNNSMSKVSYMFLWSGAWALVASYLAWLGVTVDVRRIIVTFVAGVLIAGHITTLENNLGVDGWQQAERLDIGIAVLLAVLGTVAVWCTARLSDD